MIIVAAYVVVKPGKGDEFIRRSKECVDQTRNEEGNLSYTLLRSTEDECKFTFLEEWKSKKDLDLHMKTEHFAAFGKVAEELSAKPLDIKVYDANPFQ